jgi:hypothetical protein
MDMLVEGFDASAFTSSFGCPLPFYWRLVAIVVTLRWGAGT